jgi:hypothetical protein
MPLRHTHASQHTIPFSKLSMPIPTNPVWVTSGRQIVCLPCPLINPILMPRSKRTKFYHVPSSNQVHHASFTLGDGKTSVRNSFVVLSAPDPPIPEIDKVAPQAPVDCDLHSHDDPHQDSSNQHRVSFFEPGDLIAYQKT